MPEFADPPHGAIANIERFFPSLQSYDRAGAYVTPEALCLDLQRFRGEGISEQCMDLLARSPSAYGYQDIISVGCAGRTGPCPSIATTRRTCWRNFRASSPGSPFGRRGPATTRTVLSRGTDGGAARRRGPGTTLPMRRTGATGGRPVLGCWCGSSGGWRAWSAHDPLGS